MANVYTSPRRAIPGRDMVPNSAGGYGFKLDIWERLNRFLILGSEGGTYYIRQQLLTEQNASGVIQCLREDSMRVVLEAHRINTENLAPKTDQQLFVMALALMHGDSASKKAVRQLLPDMLRTGIHLLHFAAMCKSLGGWNRTKRSILRNWMRSHEPEALAFQMVKYTSRDGWSMRDVLRVSHTKPPTDSYDAIFAWACKGGASHKRVALPEMLRIHVDMQRSITAEKSGEDGDASFMDEVCYALDRGLPMEALPKELLVNDEVWYELAMRMPVGALLRNLGNLTGRGIVRDWRMDDGSRQPVRVICNKLVDPEVLQRARLHPFAILLALLVYQSGAGLRGNKTWRPVGQVVEALEHAYDIAAGYTAPTNKRLKVCTDISGSMWMHQCIGTPLTAATAASAVAITIGRHEPNAEVVVFDNARERRLNITRRSRMRDMLPAKGGGTDLAVPIWSALTSKKFYDAFILLTDNETWAGRAHASQVLETYRAEVNPHAKLICASMAANDATIVDPDDPLSLGVAGLDANLPLLIAGFLGVPAIAHTAVLEHEEDDA